MSLPYFFIMTPKTFSIYIEKEVQSKDISHMDAVLEYWSKNNLDPDSVISLLQKPLKDKIEANARDLNFLPKMSKLPI